MQNHMTMIPLLLPVEILQEAGILQSPMLELWVENRRLVISGAGIDTPVVCDGDCDNCPAAQTDCCCSGCTESEVG